MWHNTRLAAMRPLEDTVGGRLASTGAGWRSMGTKRVALVQGPPRTLSCLSLAPWPVTDLLTVPHKLGPWPRTAASPHNPHTPLVPSQASFDPALQKPHLQGCAHRVHLPARAHPQARLFSPNSSHLHQPSAVPVPAPSPATPAAAPAAAAPPQPATMELWGNTSTFNLEQVLRQNIVSSEYYRGTCMQLTNWAEVVDEIYESVEHVEPWMSGNARGPSTAFNLMHRLFTLRLNAKEIKDMLDHRDSPFIRAVRT